MAMALTLANERTGLRDVLRDNAETWSVRDGAERRSDRLRATLWYYLTPTFIAAVPYLLHEKWGIDVQIGGIGQILSGVAIFTGLLFGLLVLMFNTGIALKKDRAVLENAHNATRVIDDARANVTYTALVALSLAVLLVIAAASDRSTDGILIWQWSMPLLWLGTHLTLNLFTILKRLRTAFNYITR
jgi:uncharacterized integral membrane protein